MLVCSCTNVTADVVDSLVERGARNWTEASASCGAVRYCGGCLKNFRRTFERSRRARDHSAVPTR